MVRPVNTPITDLCSILLSFLLNIMLIKVASLTTLTWEHVRQAGSFRDAVHRLDSFVQEELGNDTKEVSFVTLDAWDLRVQIPREARDKAVALPAYLQHARLYELRSEYTRWQAHHPEAIPFGPSSLANICAALEVEMVTSNQVMHHQQQGLYPLPFAASSPRRAIDECITLSRVLRALVKKSNPAEAHIDVFARPLDARADVRAFLGERSKVLHMSGLAHDTTQSELESWFTQHGGRPIAFWTLRTPDQHKPTGTGFAVFSSHEEAAESLCMNGRALGDRAIEVAPSSSRVLDRAAEILTPFPPSKNRPRPGDWNCPSCGFSNFQRRTACFRCSFPAASIPSAGENMMSYPFQSQSSSQGLPQHVNANIVGGGHMGMMRPPPPAGNVPFRAGDWKCGADGCGYHNFAKNVTCLRCGASRSAAAVTDSIGSPAMLAPNVQASFVPHGYPLMSQHSMNSSISHSSASTPGGYHNYQSRDHGSEGAYHESSRNDHNADASGEQGEW